MPSPPAEFHLSAARRRSNRPERKSASPAGSAVSPIACLRTRQLARSGYDDFEHEIATVYAVRGRGLVILTSCSHHGVIIQFNDQQSQACRRFTRWSAAFIFCRRSMTPTSLVFLPRCARSNPGILVPGRCTGVPSADFGPAECARRARPIHAAPERSSLSPRLHMGCCDDGANNAVQQSPARRGRGLAPGRYEEASRVAQAA